MERPPIVVDGTEVEAGQRRYGHLTIGVLAAGTPVRIPYQVLHGAADGPVVCLASTLHGWEPMGAEIIRRAMLRVDPQHLRGTVMCLPLANPLAVEFGGTIESGGLRVNPADQLDLNRVWPGKASNAWLTEQMAHRMWQEIVARSEYLIDYHDGTGSCVEAPVAFPIGLLEDQPAGTHATFAADGVGGGSSAVSAASGSSIGEMNERIRELAKAFGSRVIWWQQQAINPTTIAGQAALNGIIPLVVEAGGGGVVDETIDAGVICTLNVLKHLAMIDGDPVLPQRQIMVDRYHVIRSRTGGFFLPEKGLRLGVQVGRNHLLGQVIDPLTSHVVEECRAPEAGEVVSHRVRLPLNPGSYVAHIAATDSIIWERGS